jgi:hypothetical protein
MTQANIFDAEKQRWLEGARAVARKLLISEPSITIIDVLNKYPRPQWVHQNTTGQVFKHEDFQTCGYVKSTSKTAKGRMIFEWTLKENLRHVQRQRRFEKESVED